MRPFEVVLLLSLPIAQILTRKNRRLLFLPPALAVAQVFIEGYRWQLIPAYTLAVLLVFPALRPLKRQKVFQIIGAGLFGVSFVIAVALPYLFPVPSPNAPEGPFPVGTQNVYLVDHSRTDPFAPDPVAGRELMVQIWYPASSPDGYQKAPWMENAATVARGLAEFLELPAFSMDHLVYAETDSYEEAPVNTDDGPYPIVLFSHGYQGFRSQNTHQTQEIASRGYIVVAVEHTYGSIVTVFPDGRVAAFNPDTLPEQGDYEENFENLVSQWQADLAFTLDMLEAGGGAFDASLVRAADFEHIGALGFSTGGGAAIQFCGVDPRCDTVLGMDPLLIALKDPLIDLGYQKPLLTLFSEAWAVDRDNPDLMSLLENAVAQIDSFSIAGTTHLDFTDLPSLTPIAHALNLKGPIEGKRVLEITSRFAIEYFNQTLKEQPSAFLAAPQTVFSEVRAFRP